MNFGNLGTWNCALKLIARTCPLLVAFALSCQPLPEDGLASVFAACTQLKELTLEVQRVGVNGRATLGGIIKNNLRLKMLKLMGGWSESDVMWFKQLAREHQVLPVPTMILIVAK